MILHRDGKMLINLFRWIFNQPQLLHLVRRIKVGTLNVRNTYEVSSQV